MRRDGLIDGLLVVIVLAASCSDQGGGPSPQIHGSAPPADLPKSLPLIDIEQLRGIIAKAKQANQVLVIDFWATWCVPCRKSFPMIHDAIEPLEKRARLISISFDGPDDEAAAIRFLHDHHALDDAFIVPVDKRDAIVNGIGPNWNAVAVPAIFVFDQNGKLAAEVINKPAKELADIVVENINTLAGKKILTTENTETLK